MDIPQRTYLPEGGSSFRDDYNDPRHGAESRPLDTQDDGAIEPGLANMSSLPYPSGLSQAEEQVFQLQFQAAAASGNDESMVLSTEQMTRDHAVRQRRLGRACDACSKRKVKCGDEIPCKNCLDLGIECTFMRPAKRRGPTNKVAENLKRARFEVNDLNTAPHATSPTTAAAPPSLDSIATFDIIHHMVTSFFVYVYPIFPFPHEPIIMDRLRKRDDTQDGSFLALVAAIVATFATFIPRLAQKILDEFKPYGHEIAVETVVATALDICERSRSPPTETRDINDAATSFFQGSIAYLRSQPEHFEMFMMDSLNTVQFLGVDRIDATAYSSSRDLVTQEISKRIYWSIYNLTNSIQPLGLMQRIMPLRKTSELPPLPLKINDFYIYSDHFQQQPQAQLSTLEGFDQVAQIFSLEHPLLGFELMEPEEREVDRARTLEVAAIEKILPRLNDSLAEGHQELAAPLNATVFVEADEAGPSQDTRMQICWEIQKLLLRFALVSTRQDLLARLRYLRPSDEKLLQSLFRQCLDELAEIMAGCSQASVEPVAKIIGQRLRTVMAELGSFDMNGDDESDFARVSRRYDELFQVE